MGFLGKQFGGLNAIEKIAIVLSSFYGLGIVSLIQYNAYYTGGESLDFLRIKPIIVGLQYFIYLVLPTMVFGVPMLFFNRTKRMHWVFRMLVSIVLCLVLMLGSSIMLHYFVPFTANGARLNEVVYYLWVAVQFWSMYFYWDFFHVIGIGLILYLTWVTIFHRHSLGRRCNIVIFALCIVMNLFYFNKDVYVNIVQSAGGGAPRAGIITICNPSECMKLQNGNYFVGENEITKPCFILEENSDHFIIAEMFRNYANRHFLSEIDMRASATRIQRDSVKQFSAINYFLGFRNRDSSTSQGLLDWDVVHHLDIVLNLRLAPIAYSGLRDWNVHSYGTVTNDIVLSWWDENNGVLSAQTKLVNVMLKDGTNIVQQIKFSGVEFPCGIYVWSLRDRLSTYKNCVRIDQLPAIPNGYKPVEMELIFVCNFVYDILLPWEGQLVKGGSLQIETSEKAKLRNVVGTGPAEPLVTQ